MKVTLDIPNHQVTAFLDLLKTSTFAGVIANVDFPKVDDSKSKERVISLIQNYFFQKESLPVRSVFLFGSYARNEQTSESDVDVMMDLEENHELDLWDFIGIKHDLEDILELTVDLVTVKNLQDFAKETAEQDKILIYERESKRQTTT